MAATTEIGIAIAAIVPASDCALAKVREDARTDVIKAVEYFIS